MTGTGETLFGAGDGGAPPAAAWSAAVRVAPDRPLGTREVLTYGVPADHPHIPRGARVRVPLGRAGEAQGTVLETLDARAAQDELGQTPLKPVLGLAGKKHTQTDPADHSAGVRVPESVLELAVWASAYYHAPLGPTIASILPAAVRKATGLRTRTVVERSRDGQTADPAGFTPAVRDAFEAVRALPDQVWPLTKTALRDRLELRSVRAINQLIEAGVLNTHEVADVRTRTASPISSRGGSQPVPVLTSDQADAVERICGALGSFRGIVLDGVTGSGKTEVYLRVLDRVLARGESAIVLVPEISLTPQTAARFVHRFPEAGVVVMHSAMGGGERHAAWRRLATGEARVALGPRSVVFAPLAHRDPSDIGDVGAGPPLGLIIVDEEHDGSYKQDQSPRYHARDVALKRGQAAGCPVVLGSATPSLESLWNAGVGRPGGEGPFMHVRLPERVGGGSMPPVRVADLMDERRRARQLARRSGDVDRNPLIGPTLAAALEHTLRDPEGGQAILLLNRRGYAGYVASANPETAWVLMCAHCDVNLVVHRLPSPDGESRYAKCHHCGAMTLVPDRCPEDGSKLVLLNFGTQRLEEDLRLVLGDVLDERQAVRVDADTMRSAADYHDALDRFRSGDARLLLGTQMIAKGLDFPGVRLIGVVNADTALALPDFRATERTAQLVAQVAGRAGRSAESAGRSLVIVQTASPHNQAIRAAAAHDYAGFAALELAMRSETGLPPAGRLARIVFRERDHLKATRRAAAVAAALRDASIGGLSLRGPATAAIARVNERYRVELVLQARTTGPVQAGLALLRNRELVSADASCVVDVDPVSLM